MRDALCSERLFKERGTLSVSLIPEDMTSSIQHDYLQFWDNQSSRLPNPAGPQSRFASPDMQSLWSHGWYRPSEVREELGTESAGLSEVTAAGFHVTRKGKYEALSEITAGLCVTRKAKSEAQRSDTEQQGLIVSYSNCREYKDAVVASLKACAIQKDLSKGSKIHADIVERGLLKNDICIGNTIINMYAKCGALARAQEVFDKLWDRTVVSWNALITGYAQHGHSEEALSCFDRMLQEGFSPNATTFLCILKACGSIGAVDKGTSIHNEIVKEGLLEKDPSLGTALVDMYGKCGALAKAQEVFDGLPVHDVVSWSTIISAYAQHGHGEEALNCFERMKKEGSLPNAFTFAAALKACGSIRAADKGKDIHAEILREGLLEKDVFLGTALVGMYAKCGVLAKAQEVFDKLSNPNVVSWSALIAAYAEHGQGAEALKCFEKMKGEGLAPDAVTFLSILKACGSIGAIVTGKDIHAEIVREGLLIKNISIGNALVDMYGKCGALAKAQEVFDELPVRNVISWSALIAAYAQYGHGEEALICFEQMQCEGFSPNAVTFVSVLQACGLAGAAAKGNKIHAEIVREGLLEKNTVVGSVLVDMYAKCGALAKAQDVFDELPVRDVNSWNALITGYAQFGKNGIVFDLLNKMIGEGITPNLITLTVMLNVCRHSGLVELGQMCFETMCTSYGITPTLEHQTCMVDLYGRAGHFDKAMAMIKRIPSDSFPTWSALLGACRKWGNVKLGRLAFEHAVKLNQKDAAAYICMSNIYAAAGMKEDAYKIEVMRLKNKAWEKPGNH